MKKNENITKIIPLVIFFIDDFLKTGIYQNKQRFYNKKVVVQIIIAISIFLLLIINKL